MQKNICTRLAKPTQTGLRVSHRNYLPNPTPKKVKKLSFIHSCLPIRSNTLHRIIMKSCYILNRSMKRKYLQSKPDLLNKVWQRLPILLLTLITKFFFLVFWHRRNNKALDETYETSCSSKKLYCSFAPEWKNEICRIFSLLTWVLEPFFQHCLLEIFSANLDANKWTLLLPHSRVKTQKGSELIRCSAYHALWSIACSLP